MKGRWLPFLALVAVVAAAAYLRVTHLGANELWGDELFHYFAAHSINEGRGPLLPSGEVYDRGTDITRLVAIALRHVPSIEVASRLPTALFGVLNVVLFAALAWRVAGPWTAVAAAVLIGIYPEAVFQSRNARFYTYQLNFGLVALYGGWEMVRLAGVRRPLSIAEQRRTWAWMVVAAAALAVAARVQVTTLSIVAGLGVAVALAAGADLWARGRQAWQDSAPLYVTVAGIVAAAAAWLFARAWVSGLIASSQFTPLWRRRLAPGGESPLAYYWALSGAFPVVTSLAALIFLVVAVRNWRLAAYLLAWFAVPFVLHSVAMPWKQERFILLAVPALLLAAAVTAVAALGRAYEVAVDAFGSWGAGPRTRRLTAAAAVGAAALFAVVTTPAFSAARRMPFGAYRQATSHDFQEVARVIREVPGGDSIPLGSASPLRSMLYWPRLDFVVRRTYLERPDRESNGTNTYPKLHPEGAPDYYTGVPVIPSPAAIRERFAAQGGVIVLPDMTHDPGGPQLLDTLEREGVELCRGRCGKVKVYYWKFSDPTPVGSEGSPAPATPNAVPRPAIAPRHALTVARP